MAILQAARAKTLGLSISEAKSWGFNRAIFYAAAKRGFKKARITKRTREQIGKKPVMKSRRAYYLGTEMACISRKGNRTYFTIGRELQTETEFKRQIEVRFGSVFSKAWKDSLNIVRQCPKELLSQSRFFQDIYKPRRDELASKWTKMSE